MAVNPYFGEHKASTEQNLIEEVTIETIKLAGFDVYYIPRTQYNPDLLLNEDINSRFEKFHKIEMYLNNATDYGGAGLSHTKFGLVLDNSMEFVVSRRRFTQETKLTFPKEGDLLYIHQNKGLFQIDEVDFETAPYFQLQKNYVYTLRASLFSFSYETFDTGLKELDDQVEVLTDPFTDNDLVNDTAEEHIDFNEDNPFGDIIED